MTTQAPIKVSSATKEQIRIAAAVLGRSQSELVGAAVSEYVQRHSEALHRGLAEAHRALDLGEDETIAYLIGEPVERVREVSGR